MKQTPSRSVPNEIQDKRFDPGSRAARVAIVLITASMFALAPSSFAQRGGGGGGGGGGSHGGGGSVGGGASSGGGGWSGGGGHASGGGGSSSHSSGGGSRGSSGAARAIGGRSGSSGAGRAGSWSGTGKSAKAGRPTGFGAALRRFFGFSPAAKSTEGALGAGNAMFAGEKLPPSFGHVQLAKSPVALSEVKSVRPDIAAPPRPIPPHPRHGPYYPPYGCYGCGVGVGFGLGFGFGFPLFDFGYVDWYPGLWQQPATSSVTDMLLYLNDGSALEVADYWVQGDTLNYVTDDGKEGTIAVKDLDLQRTVDSNQRLGLKFTLDRTQRGRPFEHVDPQQ
jgi:hypothetical protein